MSSRPVGKIGTSYREKSRWISVENRSDHDIPPFAPCYFMLRGDIRSEEQPIVYPFTGAFQAETRGSVVASPANYSMCVNGPAAIPSKGFGEVTIDYPCVARVKHFKNRLNDPVKKYDSFAPVYVDVTSAAGGKAVSHFSDTGNEGLQYRIFPYTSFYRNTISAFQAIGIASEAEDLYWIVPKDRPDTTDNSYNAFSGTLESQDIVSGFPFQESNGSQEWAVLEDGGIVLNLPGVYTLSTYLLVSPGTYLTDQVATLPTDYRLEFETESLSDELNEAAFFDTSVAAIRQPSHLYRLNCSAGYDACPTMDIYRPPVSANRTAILTVEPTDKWEIPTADGKVVAKPLVKVSATRTVNINFTGEITGLFASVRVTRGGFDSFYRQGYYGHWGYWGYGWGWGYGGSGEYIG